MIGLLKKTLSICQSRWKEIRHALNSCNSFSQLGPQNKDLGVASQTSLTKVKLRLRSRLSEVMSLFFTVIIFDTIQLASLADNRCH